MIDQCYNCCFADEYLCWWWFRLYNPTCVLGNPMNVKWECKDFKMIGRNSR